MFQGPIEIQMLSAKKLSLALMLPCMVACDAWDQKSAAQEWMMQQKSALIAPGLPSVPDLIDTPPAAYTSKIQDPFDPSRISGRANTSIERGKPGVLFPDVPIASLSIVGFITSASTGRVAIVRSGNVYRSVRPGDRIGEQIAMVKQIDDQGLLLAIDGTEDQWLLRGK